MTTITLENIGKRFGTTDIFHDLSLSIRDSEFVVFVGPSGCGKSTLLRLIAGLEQATSGKISIDGRDVTNTSPHDRGLSMVFQSYALYPHMTVRQNIAFALHTEKLPKSEIDARVNEAARALQIEPYLDRKPKALSGGQRQRVAIGRAIVRDPEVFLFDEPLSNLDAALRVHMRMELAKLHADLGTTMAYVTYDQIEAMTLADRIVVLDSGVARQIGTPLELYHTPQNVFVAGFIGSPKMNLLEGRITALSDAAITVDVAGLGTVDVPVRPDADSAIGDAVTFGVRPEHVLRADDADTSGPGIPCTVEVAENIGDHAMLRLNTSEGLVMMAQASANRFWRAGDLYRIAFDGPSLHLFNSRGDSFTRISRPAVLADA